LKNRALNVFKRLKNILFRFIVFNATFNNISVISWRSVLLVEEIGVLGIIELKTGYSFSYIDTF
jgi:hypothetical protein